jgi:mannose/fructose/N-acetylgalactosamine-specific phosphotransferase system component IID
MSDLSDPSQPARGRSSVALRVLRVLAPLGALVMITTVGVALATGAPLGVEGAAIGALVWGRVTFVDLGLALLAGWLWIAWREGRPAVALVWLVLTAVTGSAALLGYVAVAAWRAHDMREVLVGNRRNI